MTGFLRNLTALLLVASMVLTAIVVGSARGQAMAAGQIVICSGQGPVTITLDENGEPTGPAHFCPDCVLSLMTAAEDVPSPTVLPAAAGRCVYPRMASQGSGLARPMPQARGPPRVA